MQIRFTKRFAKRLDALPPKARASFRERLSLFRAEPFHPLLHNHELHGPYADCRSINVTGDVRAVYWHPALGLAEFIRIGTHAELYK